MTAVADLAQHRAARAACPAWCTVTMPHDQHLAGIAAIAARLPGRFDLLTVMVAQTDSSPAVDVRISPTAGHHGALLDVDTLDEVIAALTEARRLATMSPRPVRHARAGWASTSGPGGTPRCRSGRTHLTAVTG